MSSLIFIGGVPRSGTSLVQKTLDMHSQIYAGPEFDHLSHLCSVYMRMKQGLENGRQIPYYTEDQLRNSFSCLIGDLLVKKANREGVNYLSEKTPSNALVFNELKELVPDAKFIFVVRDPRGNISSFKNVAKRAKTFGDQVPLGHHLLKDMNLIKRFISAANSFYLKNRNDCYLLRYEALLRSPERELRSLCEFMGISFESQMLELASKESDASKLINSENKTVRAWSTQGMLERKINHENIESWKKDLSKKERILIDDFFMKTKFECFAEYVFQKPKGFETFVILIAERCKLWIKQLFKRSIELAKNH